MKNIHSTIAAISTGMGRSAVGVIRLSGPLTTEIVSKIFLFKNKSKSVNTLASSTVSIGLIMDGDEKADEALLTFFKNPNSYTGEDMAELSCHGSPIILRRVMGLLIKNGAEPAGPGDFTRRAFLNGKMDLTKAEAVCDIIEARSEAALKLSMAQLFGAEKEAIQKLRSYITGILASLESAIDFENDEIPAKPQLLKDILYLKTSLMALIKNAEKGMLIRDGVKVVITGRPNAGKSSLLNAITGLNRAIVTDIPGTTRDTIEETVIIDSIPVLLIDTAGIRHATNPVEEEGIKRARNAVADADAVIFAVDGSAELTEEDLSLYSEISAKPHIIAFNKIDLIQDRDVPDMTDMFSGSAAVVPVSAINSGNINDLTKAIKSIIITSKGIDSSIDPVVSALRHKNALASALSETSMAQRAINDDLGFEIACEHIKNAAGYVSSITGEIAQDDVLDLIFSKFCIGK
jgi:tRNA modification GTPase